MNISNNSNINFKAQVSLGLQEYLQNQASYYPSAKKSLVKELRKQVENVKKWGDDKSKIVICQNYNGKYSIGMQMYVGEHCCVSKCFDKLKGRIELSQFLAIKEKDILNTEDSIKKLYKVKGASIFKQFKTLYL